MTGILKKMFYKTGDDDPNNGAGIPDAAPPKTSPLPFVILPIFHIRSSPLFSLFVLYIGKPPRVQPRGSFLYESHNITTSQNVISSRCCRCVHNWLELVYDLEIHCIC